MNITEGLSKKEIARRKKISKARKKAIEKKRKEGYKRYLAELRLKKKEKEKQKKAEKREKERQRKLVLKEKNKKKRGRKKKSGPKIDWNKRKKKKAEKEKRRIEREEQQAARKIFNYRIYTTRNGKQERLIGKFRTIEDAYERFKKEKVRSESVVFPRSTKIDQKIEASIDECILVAKTDEGPTMLRNEYGKLVEHKTTLDGWEIIDKFRNNVEETFWVWGHDNRKDRKTFDWIYDNMLIGDGFGLYEFRRVFVFRNKFLVRMDDGNLQFVICKSDFDAVRMYNLAQERAKKNGVKKLIFLGDKSDYTENTDKLIEELMSITGWTKKKILMKNTTYYIVN